ncbi:hypothetical protein DFQ26_005812 [Actinomortierella ambigua]|nr:hypothetical protein DFQ26_005812 [Actinomortierella ambigua]
MKFTFVLVAALAAIGVAHSAVVPTEHEAAATAEKLASGCPCRRYCYPGGMPICCEWSTSC